MTAGALLSPPNLISLSRLLLAGLFIVVPDVLVRAALIVVAAASDVLDGWLARRHGTESPMGAILDPLTDRFFVVAVLAVQLLDRAISPVQIAVVLLRDVVTAAGYIVARLVSWMRPFQFRARWPGKLVTAAQFLLLIALILARPLVDPLVVLVGVLSAWAIADYTRAVLATKPA